MVPHRNSTEEIVEEWDGKHPLANSWSFWYFSPSLSKAWEECMKLVGTFATIEDFWSYMNNLQSPGQMSLRCDLCLFKEGISPMWEDMANKRGGRWDVNLDRSSFSIACLDDFWSNLAMDLVGHRFANYDDMINGVVVNRREKGNRISLWTSTTQDTLGLLSLGRKLKKCLGMPAEFMLNFRSHQACASSTTCHLVSLRV